MVKQNPSDVRRWQFHENPLLPEHGRSTIWFTKPCFMSLNPTLTTIHLAPLVQRIRHENVILDSDLADLYGVPAKVLNQAVKRNIERFPDDFMFRLTEEEFEDLRETKSATVGEPGNWSQFVTGSRKHRGAAYRPYAFTEQGVAMLSSVLRSPRAVEVNIAIMRTFVQLRRLMDSNRDLAARIEAMEQKYDEQFATVFAAIHQLIAEDEAAKAEPRRQIGFSP